MTTQPPETHAELPNRFDHREAQDRIYRRWEENGYFHSEPDPSRKPYTIVIPPPNVTGALHLGHALNNTLQDVMIRYKKLLGFNTLWMPGTDHAGIATQAVVERRLFEEEGKSRHDLGREKLVERIWEWKASYETRIIGQLKRMGCSCDWERTRFTLDPVCAKAVRQTFFDLFKKQLIYRGKKLVNWDTFLQTAVSDDEVFHETTKGHFWHFKYPVIDPKPGEPEFVSLATTRPETMLGDTAVAVHPDPASALDRVEAELSEKLSAAADKEKEAIEKQIENVRSRRESMLPKLEQLRDMAADGRQVMLPLMDRPIALVTDEWAKPELGSGCVKITPAHDPNDYEVGLRQGLEMINILNPDGTLNENAGKYQGLTIKKARRQVTEDLAELKLHDPEKDVEDREIDLAHSDRSKTPIEPYLADQWFVKMDSLAQSAMDAVTDGRVTILPERYAKGYLDWLGEKRDWPIGRQLWWGHRIPIWAKAVTNEEVKPLVNRLGITDSFGVDGFLTSAGSDRLSCQLRTGPTGEDITLLVCIAPGHDDLEREIEDIGFTQETDVLDTWFSSALWPHSTLGWPEKTPELEYYYPTSVLITSRDIITLWVARMVLAGLNNMGEIPFGEVFIHPKILDGYGETMSKSKGNGVDPIDVIDKFGADALRFGLAYMTTDTQDARMPVQFECPHCEHHFDQTKKNRTLPRVECPKCGKEFSTQWAESEEDKALPRGAAVTERFEQGRNFANKLWNASRFALMNLDGFEPNTSPQRKQGSKETLAVEDRWILSRLATVTEQVTDCLENYRYAEAARTLYDFCWDQFCSFYVEMVKGRLQDDAQRATAQQVLAHTLDALLRLLSPIIPFITEEVWTLLGKIAPVRGLGSAKPQAAVESIMLASWPEVDAEAQDPQIESQFARFQAVLGALREIRSRQNIPPKESIEFAIRCDAETVTLLEPMSPYFASMANATSSDWGPDAEPPAQAAHVTLDGMEVYVDLAGFIDEDAERERLQKEIARTTGQIAGKKKKLANQNFVDRAPAEVVQRERDARAQLEEQLAALQTALKKLGG